MAGKKDEFVLYNRADLLYEVLYKRIVTPMIECEVSGDIEGYCRTVKSMVEFTKHFFKNAHKKKGIEVIKALGEIYMKLVKMKRDVNTTQKVKEVYEERTKLFAEISKYKMEAFAYMHSAKIFVLTTMEDNRPISARGLDDIHT